jgi:hypothetical protein
MEKREDSTTAIGKAYELVMKFGQILAPKVVDEIIEELNESIYEDSNLEFWYAVKEEITNL